MALPHVDDYRDDIVASIEKASGMAITTRAIHGGWDGLRPSISLEGFEIKDRRGRVALGFERAEATLSWWSLFEGRVHFYDVDFYKPALALRRGADGLIYLADKPLNKAGPDDGAFTEWLLSQPRLGIHDATLTWRDEKSGAPEIQLTGVEIAVHKHLGRYRAALTAVPPRALAGRIDLRADVKLTREGSRWIADGDAYAEGRNVDVGRLHAHLPMPDSLGSGVGNMRAWAHFNAEGVRELVADLNMRDVRGKLDADAPPLELASISGRATYRVEADGFTFATENLRFRLASGVAAQLGNFSLSRRAEAGKPTRAEMKADGIDLKVASALIDYFPVPRDIKERVQRFAPRGRILDATLAWSGGGSAPVSAFAVKGRFEELAVNAVDNLPGVSGISGRIEGTQAGGTVRLESKAMSFELERLFRQPLVFDALDARATWKPVGHALEVNVEDARFANSDGEGRVAGVWRSLPDAKERSPGYVDLKGEFTHAVASRVPSYLPNKISATRDWLERSIMSGTSNHANFEVKGDLYGFPFSAEHPGRFLVEGDIRDGRIKYHPDWPSVDAIDGTFRFENRRMEIRARSASIFASRASPITAVVDDLGAKPPVLVLNGDIDTSGADTVRFLRESPLVNGPGAFTRAVSIEGPGRLKLQLIYPLWGTDSVRVVGDYAFAGATASVGRTLAMRDVRGNLRFTESAVRANAIAGTLFGKPAMLSMATQDNQVVTTIEGKIETPQMAAYVPETIVSKLSGATEWKARLVSGKQGSELTVTSDLKGLGSSLPDPLAKPVEGARALTLTMSRLGTDLEVTSVSLADNVFGRFSRTGEHWNALLKFGSPVANEATREGLWLYGELPFVDVDAWQAVFATPPGEAKAASGEGVELRGLDLKLARTRFSGRDFREMGAQLARKGSQWSGKLQSANVAGDIVWNWEGKGRLTAKLSRLAIVEPAPGAAPAEPREAAQPDLPALDITAERFEFKGKWLGALDLKAEPAGDEWRIDKLDIVNEHAKFHSSGGWRRTGAGSLTTLALKLETENLNALMAQFGFGDYLKRGSGQLEGRLVWPGYPYDFATVNLAGNFKVEARRGQFAKIEPGAGKLLGLLSLQSLPQRVTLDFRDVFSEGFAFERIQGDVKVARGVLLTDGFEISGPSAFVSMKGEVSIPQETQALTMHIIPEVGESVALAATLIGTPVLGLSTLLVSKLLKNPFGKAVAYEYHVAGSWDNPQVTRLSGPPAAAASSTVEAAMPSTAAANPAEPPARSP